MNALLLDFLWIHLNSLDWLIIKSSDLNFMCVMWYIWIYLFIYIHKGKRKTFALFCFSLEGWKGTYCELEHTHGLNFGVEREELIEPGFSHHYELSVLFDTSGTQKWLFMWLIKVNISSIAFLLYALMSTCDISLYCTVTMVISYCTMVNDFTFD